MNAEFLHVVLALILFFHVDIVLRRGLEDKELRRVWAGSGANMKPWDDFHRERGVGVMIFVYLLLDMILLLILKIGVCEVVLICHVGIGRDLDSSFSGITPLPTCVIFPSESGSAFCEGTILPRRSICSVCFHVKFSMRIMGKASDEATHPPLLEHEHTC